MEGNPVEAHGGVEEEEEEEEEVVVVVVVDGEEAVVVDQEEAMEDGEEEEEVVVVEVVVVANSFPDCDTGELNVAKAHITVCNNQAASPVVVWTAGAWSTDRERETEREREIEGRKREERKGKVERGELVGKARTGVFGCFFFYPPCYRVYSVLSVMLQLS